MYPMIREVQKIKIESAGLSDTGKSRKLNQDTIFHQIAQINGGQPVGLFIVCDGMGGQRGGEIASRLAIDTITAQLTDFFAEPSISSKNGDTHPSLFTLNQKMRIAIEEANAQICRYAHNHADETPHLGTTVTAVLIYGNLVHITNAGDGRVYIWRRGQLTQVTQDHSLAAKLAQKGFINETEIATHPQNHIILRALGVKEHIKLDAFDWELEPGDKILICSDGLWKAFPDSSELGRLLQANSTPATLCHQLVSEAKQRDGSDDTSAIVITVSEVDEY